MHSSCCSTLAGTPSTPTGCFIPGNSAKARSLGYATEVSITLGTMAGGGTKPAVCQRNIAYNIPQRIERK